MEMRIHLRFFLVLALTAASTQATTTPQFELTEQLGFQGLESLAVGMAGLWGIAQNGTVFYRQGTYMTFQAKYGYEWTSVSGVPMKQLDVGYNSVWAVSDSADVFFRQGINYGTVTGTGWVGVAGQVSHISVDAMNFVWAVSIDQRVFTRPGPTFGQGVNDVAWTEVTGRKLMKVDVGAAGVWGLDNDGNVYYRTGTFGQYGQQGTSWEVVPGQQLYDITAGGEDIVMGLDGNGQVFLRVGLDRFTPSGTHWVAAPESFPLLKSIDADFNFFWGVFYGSGKVLGGTW